MRAVAVHEHLRKLGVVPDYLTLVLTQLRDQGAAAVEEPVGDPGG